MPKDSFRQLCWKCKLTNANKCEWFRTTEKHPEYVEVDKDNFIISCKKFIPSEELEIIKVEDICKQLGISNRTYYRRLRDIKKVKGNNMLSIKEINLYSKDKLTQEQVNQIIKMFEKLALNIPEIKTNPVYRRNYIILCIKRVLNQVQDEGEL